MNGSQLVSREERHLKTSKLDFVEMLLLWLCGLLIFSFTMTVFLDVVTRSIGKPLLWLQEATLTTFVWGVFTGAAVALRRNEHFYLTTFASSMTGRRRILVETFNGVVMLTIAGMIAYFGFLNFRQSFGNVLPVTGLPLSTITGIIPVFGVLSAAFTLERFVKGWQNGFMGATHDERDQAQKQGESNMGQI
ncbi:TRAP transporter small permease [Amycolatopsis palatopharyngis]|uniref:TRAP transporter small permease n=1 Tax=Amycolatopsis palatopharyngis TaxID=187982 RepID=UPI000E22EA28|nr:TRAP transporter small permease [Amycolatopsis palatopharyngis]